MNTPSIATDSAHLPKLFGWPSVPTQNVEYIFPMEDSAISTGDELLTTPGRVVLRVGDAISEVPGGIFFIGPASKVFVSHSTQIDELNSLASGQETFTYFNNPNVATEHEPNFKLSDPWGRYTAEQEQRSIARERVWEFYMVRIQELDEYALEDEIVISQESKQDCLQFVYSTAMTTKAALFLMDNGNLRAVWKDDEGGHVGIQFFGKQQAECVIFKLRGISDFVSRVAGRDTLNGVKRQIHAFDLDSLVGV